MVRTLLVCAAIVLGALRAPCAFAFPLPLKPIRILVPVPAGSVADIQARLIATALAESIGHRVVVENRPGGSTLIALREVIAAPADGHTLVYAFGSIVMLPHLHREAPYDFFRDFTPVMNTLKGGLVLAVHQSIPARDVAELIAYAKANPGKISFGSSGAGTSTHLSAELLMRLTGIEMVHVPYKGSVDAARDLLSGRIQLIFDPATAAMANARTGMVRLLATARAKRFAMLPEVPTLRESGIDIAFDTWAGFFGPGAMQRTITETLFEHLARAVRNPATRESLAAGGTEEAILGPEAYAKFVRQEYEQWGAVIRELGVRLD